MSDDEKKTQDFGTAASKVVTLAIELVPKELVKTPQRIISALNSPAALKKIEETLRKNALALMNSQLDVNGESAATQRRIAGELAKNYAQAVTGDVRRQLELSPRVARLKGAVKDLGKSFEQTPVGVFVDENKAIVYIVGAVAAVGGGAGIYMAKNDTIAGGFQKLLGLVDLSTTIGKVKLAGELTHFAPEKEKIGGKVSVSSNWKQLKFKLNIASTFHGDSVTVATDGRLLVPLGHRQSLLFTGRIAGGHAWGSGAPSPLGAEPGSAGDGVSSSFRMDFGIGLQFKLEHFQIDTLGYIRQTDYLNSFPGAVFADPTMAGLSGGPFADPGGSLTGGLGIQFRRNRQNLPFEIQGGGFLEGGSGLGVRGGAAVGVWW